MRGLTNSKESKRLSIALATINARYAHSALALRYLKANLGALEAQTEIVEFVSGARAETMAEVLLAGSPAIIGLSVYIWNVEELTRLAALIKVLAPNVALVLGGPEVSHETNQQAIVALADYVITGAGEHAFARLCGQLLRGNRPLLKKIAGDSLLTEGLVLPYYLYNDRDIAHRYLYLEASRGCPFKCEFCLSSLDKTAVPFEMAAFLIELDKLYSRGARSFKFIDRTFNLRIDDCIALLNFFLERIEQDGQQLLLHFELIPDHLPERLREPIARFPAGSLQFEIGIQTWNPTVQALISRRQNNDKSQANLQWLRTQTRAHLHVDLIAGLPGETLDSFAAGFDRLARLRPHEIQVGILKRLRGTPIIRHTAEFDLRFNPNPPYNLLANSLISFEQMQGISRFARFWDLIGNSGHYENSLPSLLGLAGDASPFERFNHLSRWIYRQTDSTHRIAADRLYALVADWIRIGLGDPEEQAAALRGLAADQALRVKPRSPDRTLSRLRHQRAITPSAASEHLTP